MTKKEQAEEMRREKARKMRYKKPISKALNLEQIRSDLNDIQGDAQELAWTEDDEALVAALDGDTDEAWEFRMAFSDLVADAERMERDLDESWVPECFDTFFPAVGTRGGYLGFDEYEGDYFGIEAWEDDYAERCARDKLMQMRKADIFDAAGACLRIAQQYMALMYRYDCLRASIDILKNQNEGLLQIVRGIETQYELAEEETSHFRFDFGQEVSKLDRMLWNIPDRLWIE